METIYDVVGIGCCAVDTLALYEGLIKEDQKMEIPEVTRQGGGLVATGLVAVARLGGKARFIGKVGDDDPSQFIIREFEKEGIDTSCINIQPGASVIRAIGLINPAKGHRTLFYCLADTPIVDPGELNREDVLAGKVLFVDGFQVKAAIQAAQWARTAGRMVLMDAELTEPENDTLAELSTHVVSSLGFARSRLGGRGRAGKCDGEEAAQRLYEKYAARHSGQASSAAEAARQRAGLPATAGDPDKVVAVTSGVEGAYFVSSAGAFHQPSFKVPVVDTTGCGDVFHGAFAFGLAQDWELPKIARFAAAVAALKCRKLGGRAGIPTFEETEKLLAEQTIISNCKFSI